MPIPNEEYDISFAGSKIRNFLKDNSTQAYSYEELTKQFGDGILPELEILIIAGVIEAKTILVKGKGERTYFRWKKKI
jgi:hypothetical protein